VNSKLIFIIAFCAIVFGLYGVSDLLLNSEQPAPMQSVKTVQPTVKKIQVYFAKLPLNPGEKVTLAQLKKQILEEPEANKLGISEDTILPLTNGTVANMTIVSGSIVTADMLLGPDQAGYLDLVIEDNHIPYAIKVDRSAVVGGVINPGTLVDILAIASTEQNLATNPRISSYKSLSISPLIMAVKVLQVKRATIAETRNNPATEEVHLILQLTRKQNAKLTIAKRITLLEVQKSAGTETDRELRENELKANAGDVIAEYKAITSYRANSVSTN
jgi:pilus assembly protein CpaB